MNFLDKLNFLLNKYQLNKHTFALASGIPYTTIDGLYKKGYKKIKLDTLEKIAHYFNVPIDYLVREDITDPQYDKAFNAALDLDELRIMEAYRSLASTDKETIRLLLQRLSDENADGV